MHIDLTQDLSTISDLVGQQVNDAAQRITHSLAERGEHITLTLGQIGDNMIQQLTERGGEMLDRLESTSDETSRAIALASERLSSSLDFKTNHIGEEFAEIATGLEDMMTSRLDRVTERFLREIAGGGRSDDRALAGAYRRYRRNLEPIGGNDRDPRRRGQFNAQVHGRIRSFSISNCVAAKSRPSCSRPAIASPRRWFRAALR